MVKIICVNKKRTEQVTGYGLWSILTIILLIFGTASIIEFNSFHEANPEHDNFQIFQSYTCINDDTLWKSNNCEGGFYYNIRTIFMLIFNGMNFTIIILWIYDKQQKFKFSWCLNGENKK